MPPAPEDEIVGAAAVPLDAVPGDAVAAGVEATPIQAVSPTRGTTPWLCVVSDSISEPYLYCRQYFGIPADSVRIVTSWKEMTDVIFSYERIGTLVILSHGGLAGGDLVIGGRMRTLSMFAKGVPPDEEEPFLGLGTWPGSAGTLRLEGCTVGADPAALFDFVTRVPVSRVEAWSLARYLDAYTLTVDGDRQSYVDQLRADGTLERAAPYLPKGASGGTYTASELEAMLLGQGGFTVFAEVFGHDFPWGVGESGRFGELVKAPLPFVPGEHFTRADGVRERRTVRSDQEAATVAAEIGSTRPVLHQVVAER